MAVVLSLGELLQQPWGCRKSCVPNKLGTALCDSGNVGSRLQERPLAMDHRLLIVSWTELRSVQRRAMVRKDNPKGSRAVHPADGRSWD